MASFQEGKNQGRVEMDDGGRSVTRITKKHNPAAKRRITKDDGALAKLADIKSSVGIVIPLVKTVQLNRKKADQEKSLHRTNIIFPSEMARSRWCPRATYYRMSGLPQPPSSTSFTLENVFAEGNAIHHKWQSWLSDSGLMWGDWRCSRCGEYISNSTRPDLDDGVLFGPCVGTEYIDLDNPAKRLQADTWNHDWKYKEVTLRSNTLPISGHADGALTKHNCLIELKSVGMGTLRFEAPELIDKNTYSVSGRKITDLDGIWKNLHRPLMSHVKQGNIYLWMAEQMGLPFDSIVFVYEFKGNQSVKEFQVTKSDDILRPMLETSAHIQESLSTGIAPDCPFGGCTDCRAYEKEMGK